MQIICVVPASYTLGFLRAKNPWLVFRVKHKNLKQNFLVFFFMEKKHIIQFQNMKKMLIILFSYNFGDKKTDEKSPDLIPDYGKIACYKIS